MRSLLVVVHWSICSTLGELIVSFGWVGLFRGVKLLFQFVYHLISHYFIILNLCVSVNIQNTNIFSKFYNIGRKNQQKVHNILYKCVDCSRHNGIKGAKAKCAHNQILAHTLILVMTLLIPLCLKQSTYTCMCSFAVFAYHSHNITFGNVSISFLVIGYNCIFSSR